MSQLTKKDEWSALAPPPAASQPIGALRGLAAVIKPADAEVAEV